ncbi:MAG TPA: PQQ-binding-like beta-propeller repeat protein [Tepidisphaeraceae bacterium]|jgi:outer membrane protein assembly factor BamB|nr:PQQ-binding-like beta-propeller repeat protein [Tepidisphaeraceae bacterium]
MSLNMLNRKSVFATAAVAAASSVIWIGVCAGEGAKPAASAPPAPAAQPAAADVAGKFVIDQPHVPVGEWPMWGLTPHRNMVSPEKNPPTDWDVATGKNVLWIQPIGSKSYGNPIVAQGFVTIGTNNEGHRDPANTLDGGVEMAFDQLTGKFLWQKFYGKLPTGRVNDWPGEGLCATAYSEPGKLWYCTNQCHVVCLDMSPGATKLADGSPPVTWDVDMIAKLGVFPHNMTSSAIASWGDYIYVITANGVDDTHKHVVAPDAPAIVCFDKNTGKVVWTDNTPGANVLHGQWASVAIVEINGRPIVIAPLGDAWIYAYDARTGKIIWRFDTNPKDSVYPQTRNEIIATPCIVGPHMFIANGQDPEHGEGYGHLYCVDITGAGDVSEELDAVAGTAKPKVGDELVAPAGQVATHKGKPNPNSKVVWHYSTYDLNHDGKIDRSEHMNRTISTALVTPEGLCFAADFSGFLHCLDAKSGQVYWTYDMESAMWGSPMYADGKVYVTDEDGDVRIFPVSKTMPKKDDVIEHNMGGAAIYCSPVLVNGVLYVMTRDHLFAIKAGAQSKPFKAD